MQTAFAMDLPVLGEVAYAAGHLDVTIEAWERAHGACMRAGDQVAAAGAAVPRRHASDLRHCPDGTGAWLVGRAEQLLEGCAETSAHAWLAVVRAYERMLTGDLPGARQWTRQAIEVGSKSDAAAAAWTGGGGPAAHPGRRCSARSGAARSGRGRGHFGDLDPLSTGLVYCEIVCALQGLAQYDVAEEWTEAMGWCEDECHRHVHGRCRVHRAEILRLRGSCTEAESQAACQELGPYLRRELGWPLNELGRIRLQSKTSRAPRRCSPLIAPGGILNRVSLWCVWPKATWPPRLPRSRSRRVPLAGAVEERPPNTDLQRAPLEAQVKIEIAAGDARARSAADGLELVAARFKQSASRQRRPRSRKVRRRRRRCGEARNSPCPKQLYDCGTKSAPRTRRRLHYMDLAEAHHARGTTPRRPRTTSGPHDPRRDPSRADGHPSSRSRAP